MWFIFINFMCNFIYLFISRKRPQTWSIDRSRQHHQMMNKRAQLLKKQITSHLLYHRCHPFTTQLYQHQYIHHHILHRISPDNQLQCRNNPSFLQLCRISVTSLLNRRHINQPIDFLDASLTDFLPTPRRPRSNNVIEKKLYQMNKRLNTLERNQVDINNILVHILQSLKRDQPLQQQQQLQQPQPQLQQQQPQPPTDSNPFCDIPEPDHISLEELIKVDKAAFNAGNFSCKLVNRLFPELFGPDHLRTRYSYHGQGKVNKSELDPIRKGYIQRYVLYFHPDVKDPKFYQNIVVVKINEMLRRPVMLIL